MNRHQVLTGACNFGEKCYAVGSVEGIHFTVSGRKSIYQMIRWQERKFINIAKYQLMFIFLYDNRCYLIYVLKATYGNKVNNSQDIMYTFCLILSIKRNVAKQALGAGTVLVIILCIIYWNCPKLCVIKVTSVSTQI